MLRSCLTASVGFGAKPHIKLDFALIFCKRYGGALRHPPILTNSVEFIDKCLLFIFLKKSVDNSFFLW